MRGKRHFGDEHHRFDYGDHEFLTDERPDASLRPGLRFERRQDGD
jgi:hypothetical protein